MLPTIMKGNQYHNGKLALRLRRVALWEPGLTVINYKRDNFSKYVCLAVKIDIIRKIIKFVNC